MLSDALSLLWPLILILFMNIIIFYLRTYMEPRVTICLCWQMVYLLYDKSERLPRARLLTKHEIWGAYRRSLYPYAVNKFCLDPKCLIRIPAMWYVQQALSFAFVPLRYHAICVHKGPYWDFTMLWRYAGPCRLSWRLPLAESAWTPSGKNN